jgi:hypothetical protein
VISADAVDPGINVIGVDIDAGGEGGLGRGDALGFLGEASLPLGLGFRVGGVGTVIRGRVDGVHGCNLALVTTGCQGEAAAHKTDQAREQHARRADHQQHGQDGQEGPHLTHIGKRSRMLHLCAKR